MDAEPLRRAEGDRAPKGAALFDDPMAGRVGRPGRFVLGRLGRSRIITTVLATMMNLVDDGMAPQKAIDAPRFHHQGRPDEIYPERPACRPTPSIRSPGWEYKQV
jgi:gamma-glutamyltranspeptidase